MSIKPRFIISDLHLGEGQHSRHEDFDEQATENFVQFFTELSSLGGSRVIIYGDFIDFSQIQLDSKSTPPQKFLGATEAESTLRLQKAIAGHPDVFDALKKFLAIDGNELLLIPGNHDIDFAWNRVLKTLTRWIGATRKNFKFGMVYKEGGVFVTHGHQYSDDNQIDTPINFTFNRLNSCWGSYFVENFFNSLEDRYPLLDNARPTWKAALSAMLYDEVLVTGKFAAELLIFLKNFRIPLKDYVRTFIMGWQPKTRSMRHRDIDSFTDDFKVHVVRERLQELRGNPVFKREFDGVFQQLSETQWEQLFSRYSGIDYEIQDFLQNTESRPQSRGFFNRTDNYQEASKFIARHHEDTRVVVMGHTHDGMDAERFQMTDSTEEFSYFNSGTWTKSYNIPWWKLPGFETLVDPSGYSQNSSVIRCTGEDNDLEVIYFDRWQDALT